MSVKDSSKEIIGKYLINQLYKQVKDYSDILELTCCDISGTELDIGKIMGIYEAIKELRGEADDESES